MKPSTLINLFFKAGLFNVIHRLWPNRLTVLAYHRIIDPHPPEFDTFKPNVSATPAGFARHMDYLSRRFNVVSVDHVNAWLRGEESLPANPALITFDDGYRDNFDHALPVLQQRNLPAVIFLATDYIGNNSPFFWDLIAYCFHHTDLKQANLPVIGPQGWADEQSRTVVMSNWLNSLKRLPDDEKWAAVKQLPSILNVAIPTDAFDNLHLTWDQVRQLVAAGVEMGGHTRSHPILTRVSPDQARSEITGSKARIEAEINRPVTSFAYPNGLPTDFNLDLQTILKQAGFETSFTLVPGPARFNEARRTPLEIRRVYIGHRDTLPRFAAKVMGLPRLLGWQS